MLNQEFVRARVLKYIQHITTQLDQISTEDRVSAASLLLACPIVLIKDRIQSFLPVITQSLKTGLGYVCTQNDRLLYSVHLVHCTLSTLNNVLSVHCTLYNVPARSLVVVIHMYAVVLEYTNILLITIVFKHIGFIFNYPRNTRRKKGRPP